MTRSGRLVAAALLAAGTAWPTISNATVTVLGWPGGSEETALRATVGGLQRPSGRSRRRQGGADLLQPRRLLRQAAGRHGRRLGCVRRQPRRHLFDRPLRPLHGADRARRRCGKGIRRERSEDHAVRRQAVWRADRPVAALHVLPQGPDRRAAEGRGGPVRNMPRSPRRSSARSCSRRIPTAGLGTTGPLPRSTSPSRSIPTARRATAPCCR